MNAQPNRYKLLIADDDPMERDLIRLEAERLGHEVVEAADGTQAWQALQEPDLPRILIFDWKMPPPTGPELCELIRFSSTDTMPYVYIILLTGRDHQEEIVAGLVAGADDYMIKPPDREKFEARIAVAQRVLARSDRLAALASDLGLANAMLGKFSQELAHDLRNTINTVSGHAYLLLNAPDPIDDNARVSANAIRSAAQRMTMMVNDVLVLETTSKELLRESFDIRSLIGEASVDTPNLDVLIRRLPDVIVAHRASIHRSFKNLFDNAARYARRADDQSVKVTIDCEEDANSWRFSIDDDGPGVPEIDHPVIFDAFRRGASTVDDIGLGLGLSIVAACARSHHGSVSVASAPEGGARFVMTIGKPTPETETSELDEQVLTA